MKRFIASLIAVFSATVCLAVAEVPAPTVSSRDHHWCC